MRTSAAISLTYFTLSLPHNAARAWGCSRNPTSRAALSAFLSAKGKTSPQRSCASRKKMSTPPSPTPRNFFNSTRSWLGVRLAASRKLFRSPLYSWSSTLESSTRNAAVLSSANQIQKAREHHLLMHVAGAAAVMFELVAKKKNKKNLINLP